MPTAESRERVTEISQQIAKYVDQLRPITAAITAGSATPDQMAENNRLQSVIAKLDQERETLLND